jgi:hypothetical protein
MSIARSNTLHVGKIYQRSLYITFRGVMYTSPPRLPPNHARHIDPLAASGVFSIQESDQAGSIN